MRVFISAELSTLSSTENSIRTEKLKSILESRKMSFVKVEGYYKGVKEDSFMITTNFYVEVLSKLAFNLFNQESVMICDSLANCKLKYQDGKLESIGSLSSISHKEVELYDNFSIINNVAYTCL